MAFPAGAQSGRSITPASLSSLFNNSDAASPGATRPRYPWIVPTTLGGSVGRRGKMEDRASQLYALWQNITHLPEAWFTHV